MIVNNTDLTPLDRANKYSLKGELLTNFGVRVYPVAYTYDAQGRRKTMITWKNFAARTGAAVTTWNLDPTNGTLVSKVYDDGRGTTNSYTPGGRLHTRTWARGIVTTYHTNTAGQAWATTYSEGTTPAVTNHFDRLGRVTNILDGAGSRFLAYDPAGRLLMETNASGVLAGVALLHTYDALGRRTNVSVHNSSTPLLQHAYAYDAASRLTNASDGPFNATYAYLANSPLVSQITHRSNSVTAMTTTKSYDYLNRLLSIANEPAAAGETPITYAYLYNDPNQRLRRTDPDDSYWLYEYDPLGQLTSGKHYWQDHTPVAGQQFEYAYDDIGNRTSTREGGDATGAGLRSATYGANNLNQYTNRTVPGAADITGIAHANASVTVNNLSTYRKDEYFWKELSLANTNAPVWTNVSIVASLTGTNQTNAGNLLHPKATESFLFDADGNQTSDSLWTNSWDGENRLIVTESGAGVPAGGKARQTWTLDGQSRWVHRVIYTWNGSAYVASATNRFVWDGKVLLAILDHTNGIAQSYLRGLDLAGSLQGAGGAGGVLAVNIPTNGIHFMAYDGNGNVAGMVNGPAGIASGRYAYDPFANTLQDSGAAAQANRIRFSTQFADDVSGELKYLYRGLKPSIGRWLNRDPLGESTQASLMAFHHNVANNGVDYLGLACATCCCCVEDFTLEDHTLSFAPPGNLGGPGWVGFQLEFYVGLSYQPSTRHGSCTMVWKERTNKPYVPGMRENEWNNMVHLFPTADAFLAWGMRNEPCPGRESLWIPDHPAIQQGNLNDNFTYKLEFDIEIFSSPLPCVCSNPSLRFRGEMTITLFQGRLVPGIDPVFSVIED